MHIVKTGQLSIHPHAYNTWYAKVLVNVWV